MNDPVLAIENFGVSFSDKIILSSVTLDIFENEVVTLMGPTGTGKSTLLRTIAGFNEANPNLKTWGNVYYSGEPVSDSNRPSMVMQSAKLMISTIFENIISSLPERFNLNISQQQSIATRLLENAGLSELIDKMQDNVVELPLHLQRRLSIVRLVAANPRVIFIDEPTFGIQDYEAWKILDHIKIEGGKRSVVVVLHNQEQAKYLQGKVALMAGGVIQEYALSEKFFTNPDTSPAQEYIKNGICCIPSPSANPDDLDPEYRHHQQTDSEIHAGKEKRKKRKFKSDSFGPRGFLWLERGIIAGTPKPGIVADLDYDLAALKRVGITYLVTLTEEKPVEEWNLEEYGITSRWLPFADMGVPTFEEALILCEEMHREIQDGHIIAVHCKAGLGRTGTILCSYLIWKGKSAFEALEYARNIEPRWVQSDEQAIFLEEFANYLADSKKLVGNGE